MYIVVILLIVGIVVYLVNLQSKAIKKLKEEYDNALRRNDKRIALEAGRKYYSAVRGKGVLTTFDEQAIANDISAMDDTRKNN